MVLDGNTRPVHAWRGMTETHTSSLDSADPTESLVAIPKRPREWLGFLHTSHVSDHAIGFPRFPPPLVASPPTLPPFDRAYLPVWPPTRYSWPSPRCLRTGRRLEEEAVSLESVVARICGEADGCVSTNVLLIWTSTRADGCRPEMAADGSPLFGCPGGGDTGERPALRWTTNEFPHGGSCHIHGRTSKGTEISRICWATNQISSGCSGC